MKGPDGRSGVWFYTLDADPWLAVTTAQLALGLPYRQAKTHIDQVGESRRWTSERRSDHARADLEVEVAAGPARSARSGLERFLVERYALYTTRRGRLWRGELDHEPWRVRDARLIKVQIDTVQAAGFQVRGDAHVLVGDPVSVRVFRVRHQRR